MIARSSGNVTWASAQAADQQPTPLVVPQNKSQATQTKHKVHFMLQFYLGIRAAGMPPPGIPPTGRCQGGASFRSSARPAQVRGAVARGQGEGGSFPSAASRRGSGGCRSRSSVGCGAGKRATAARATGARATGARATGARATEARATGLGQRRLGQCPVGRRRRNPTRLRTSPQSGQA